MAPRKGRQEPPMNILYVNTILWTFESDIEIPIFNRSTLFKENNFTDALFCLQAVTSSETTITIELLRVLKEPDRRPDDGYCLRVDIKLLKSVPDTQCRIMNYDSDYVSVDYEIADLEAKNKNNQYWSLKCVIQMIELNSLGNQISDLQEKLLTGVTSHYYNRRSLIQQTKHLASLLKRKSLSRIFTGRQGHTFAINKCIFMERTFYFASEIYKKFDAKKKNTSYVPYPCQEEYLFYIYCGENGFISVEEAVDLYFAAAYYGLEYLQVEYGEFLLTALEKRYESIIVFAADLVNDHDFIVKALKLYRKIINKALNSMEFQNLENREDARRAMESFLFIFDTADRPQSILDATPVISTGRKSEQSRTRSKKFKAAARAVVGISETSAAAAVGISETQTTSAIELAEILADGEKPETPATANGEKPEIPAKVNDLKRDTQDIANVEKPEILDVANGVKPDALDTANGEKIETPDKDNVAKPETQRKENDISQRTSDATLDTSTDRKSEVSRSRDRIMKLPATAAIETSQTPDIVANETSETPDTAAVEISGIPDTVIGEKLETPGTPNNGEKPEVRDKAGEKPEAIDTPQMTSDVTPGTSTDRKSKASRTRDRKSKASRTRDRKSKVSRTRDIISKLPATATIDISQTPDIVADEISETLDTGAVEISGIPDSVFGEKSEIPVTANGGKLCTPAKVNDKILETLDIANDEKLETLDIANVEKSETLDVAKGLKPDALDGANGEKIETLDKATEKPKTPAKANVEKLETQDKDNGEKPETSHKENDIPQRTSDATLGTSTDRKSEVSRSRDRISKLPATAAIETLQTLDIVVDETPDAAVVEISGIPDTVIGEKPETPGTPNEKPETQDKPDVKPDILDTPQMISDATPGTSTDRKSKVSRTRGRISEPSATAGIEISETSDAAAVEISEKLITVAVEMSEKLITVAVEISEKLVKAAYEISEKQSTAAVKISEKLASGATEISEKLATAAVKISETLATANGGKPETLGTSSQLVS